MKGRPGTLAVLSVVLSTFLGGAGFGAPATAVAPPAGSEPLTVAALDRRIKELDASADRNRVALVEAESQRAAAHDRSKVRGRAFYRLTRAGMLPLGGGFDALVTHAMHVERARQALVSDLQVERESREHAVLLAQALQQGVRERASVFGQREAAEAQRAAAHDDERRQQAFARAFDPNAGGRESITVNGPSTSVVEVSGGGGGSAGSAGFASARGRLLFPVAGRAEARAARREGTDGPGLEVTAPLGSVVRAVYGGRVAFADRYGPYGRMVILDHGAHYYTVSGNLGSVDVKVGDELSAGERVGTVGDEGQGAMLYFEVRHRTDTVPPEGWLGIR